MGQFHLDVDSYLGMMRAEVPAYDELQALVGRSTAGIAATRVLDLGTGTGETADAVLRHHPDASLVGLDASERMLAVAGRRFPKALFVQARIEDPLPRGPFDLVVSAFCVHHLDGNGKRGLFRRIKAVLAPGGRFVMLDVVIPPKRPERPVPLEVGVDLPSTVEDLVLWLSEAGLEPRVEFAEGDLAVVSADEA